jgi:hypothetical protein
MRKLLLANVLIFGMSNITYAENTLERLHNEMSAQNEFIQRGIQGNNTAGLLKKELENQALHCENVKAQRSEMVNSIEKNLFMVERNARVLDMTIEFVPLLKTCYSDVITDLAGSFKVYYRFVKMNDHPYINLHIVRQGEN